MPASRLSAIVLVLSASAAAAAAAPAHASVRVTLSGGTSHRVELCGASRHAHTVPVGGRASLSVRGADSGRMVVRIDRCAAGKWVAGSRRVVRVGRRRLDTANPGDFRVRVRISGTRGLRAVRYLRVGVGEIVDARVSFHVRNVNRTAVPCTTDGREYDVAGELVTPRSALAGADHSLALYLHAAATDHRHIWRQRNVPGYDHLTEMARLGHASVAIDLVGYGASGLPNGADVCLGSEADIVHQVITQLRSGDYQLAVGAPARFGRVALVTESVGGMSAVVDAYSFGDADALALGGYGFDEFNSPEVALGPAASGAPHALPICAQGGEPKRPGAPAGYAYFFVGVTPEDVFFDAEPAIVSAHFTSANERDSCGLFNSVIPGAIIDRLHIGEIHVPVLLISGREDRFFPPSAMTAERDLFSGSPDVQLKFIDNAGHHPVLERAAPTYRANLSAWLHARGF